MDIVRQQGSYRVRVCIADATRMSAQLIAVALKRYRHKLDICSFAGNSSEVFFELRTSRPDIAVISAQLEDGRLAGFKVVGKPLPSTSKTRSVMSLDAAKQCLPAEA